MGLLLLIAIVLLADQGMKDIVERTEGEKFPKAIEETGGMVVLHKNHNDGFPFGFLGKYPVLVKQIPIMVVSAAAGVFGWLYGRRGHSVEKLGFAMLLGGGLSNLYDRLVRGYVVDYFSIQWKKLKNVVFNLGDLFVFAGALLVVAAEIAELFRESR